MQIRMYHYYASLLTFLQLEYYLWQWKYQKSMQYVQVFPVTEDVKKELKKQQQKKWGPMCVSWQSLSKRDGLKALTVNGEYQSMHIRKGTQTILFELTNNDTLQSTSHASPDKQPWFPFTCFSLWQITFLPA